MGKSNNKMPLKLRANWNAVIFSEQVGSESESNHLSSTELLPERMMPTTMMPNMVVAQSTPCLTPEAASLRPGGGNSSLKMLEKTKMCVFFEDSKCTKGANCTYAHALEERQKPPNFYRTKISSKWSAGRCPFSAEACRFAHGKAYIRRMRSHFTRSIPVADQTE